MKDEQIFALMAKTPDIRAVQICDSLDQDLPRVSAALRDLVEVGDIVQAKGTAPNGHPAQVYNFSDAFKKTKAYQAAMSAIGPSVAATAPPAPMEKTAPAQAKPQPVTIPVFGAKTQPAQSKAQRGVAYIEKMNEVAQDELRTVMGLTRQQTPGAWLASAVKKGTVHKDGHVWKAGAAPLAKAADTPAKEHPLPVARKVEPRASAIPVFRCGLWSDGVLELQRDGSTVAVLEQDEGEQLASFVNRMLLDPLGVSLQTSAQ